MQTENALLNDFISRLEKLQDNRRGEGKRHKQSLVLLLVLFSTMSGYLGYRAIGDFIDKHREELIKLLNPSKDRLPSFSTVRRVLKCINPILFHSIYQDWLGEVQGIIEGESTSGQSPAKWYPVDGKTIRGTGNLGQEDYVHLVSILSGLDKVVVDSAKISSKSNEIPCVQK